MLSLETKLTRSLTTHTSGPQTNATAVAAIGGGEIEDIAIAVEAMVSMSAAPAAAVRATLAYTRYGTANTIGLQIPASAKSPTYFRVNVQGDPGTQIVLTLPALGAGVIGECALLGFHS